MKGADDEKEKQEEQLRHSRGARCTASPGVTPGRSIRLRQQMGWLCTGTWFLDSVEWLRNKIAAGRGYYPGNIRVVNSMAR
jgi:hypothetical protein